MTRDCYGFPILGEYHPHLQEAPPQIIKCIQPVSADPQIAALKTEIADIRAQLADLQSWRRSMQDDGK